MNRVLIHTDKCISISVKELQHLTELQNCLIEEYGDGFLTITGEVRDNNFNILCYQFKYWNKGKPETIDGQIRSVL